MRNRSFIALNGAPLLAVILCLSAAAVQPCPAKSSGAPLRAEAMQAFRTLEKVEYFANGSVGIRGGMSEGENALRVLLEEKNSSVVMRGLFKTATPAGKLYALLGLRRMGNAREVAVVASVLRAQKGFVNVRRGCMGSREAIRAVTAQIQNGRIVSTSHWGEWRTGRNKWVAQ